VERLKYDDQTAFTLADDASTVARIVRTTAADKLRSVKFGDWTALEVIGHITDTAEVFAERVRKMVAEDKPRLAPMDQDQVHAERKNNERDPMEISKRLQAAHAELVRLLMERANRDRLGIHGEWGEIDAAHVAAYQARHAHEHVTEIAAKFPPSN
jgi:DinB family protein